MKKSVYVILGLLVLTIGFTSCGYNSMVKSDEAVQSQWAQVQNVYQRRADLIPNLVNTVKGAANFEQQTLTKVMEARAKATSIQVDPNKLTEDNVRKFQNAQGELSQALGRLMMITENYPNLKANESFLALQAQLEGTENRITVERQKFNEVTQKYNSQIRTFPNNITAAMFNFEKKGYFQADAGAEKAPTVDFGTK